MAETISKINLRGSTKIIFFDGICNLCNSSVAKIIRNDRRNIFSFASLQSQFTIEFFRLHNFNRKSDSIVYFNGEKFFEKSNAVLRICKHLRFPVPLLLTGWIIPRFIRDVFYNFIAHNRYKWFGHRETCMVPTPELKSRFLD